MQDKIHHRYHHHQQQHHGQAIIISSWGYRSFEKILITSAPCLPSSTIGNSYHTHRCCCNATAGIGHLLYGILTRTKASLPSLFTQLPFPNSLLIPPPLQPYRQGSDHIFLETQNILIRCNSNHESKHPSNQPS